MSTLWFFATLVRVCVFLFQVIFLSGSAFRRDGFRCLTDAKCVGDVRVWLWCGQVPKASRIHRDGGRCGWQQRMKLCAVWNL